MNAPHEKTSYEFLAKSVNDLLKKRTRKWPTPPKLGFMTFVYDQGEGGYLAYIASTRRIDAIRIIFEWLQRLVPTLTDEQVDELLGELRKEREARKSEND